jgi:hypothetical protein
LKYIESDFQRNLWHVLEGKGLEMLTIVVTLLLYARIKYVMVNDTKATHDSSPLLTPAGAFG